MIKALYDLAIISLKIYEDVMMKFSLCFCLLAFLSIGNIAAAETPWGNSKVIDTQYKPQKVVYDVAVNSEGKVTSVLDRASYLSKITGADPFD